MEIDVEKTKRTCENCLACKLVPSHVGGGNYECSKDVHYWFASACSFATTDEDLADTENVQEFPANHQCEYERFEGALSRLKKFQENISKKAKQDSSKTADECINDCFDEMQMLISKGKNNSLDCLAEVQKNKMLRTAYEKENSRLRTELAMLKKANILLSESDDQPLRVLQNKYLGLTRKFLRSSEKISTIKKGLSGKWRLLEEGEKLRHDDEVCLVKKFYRLDELTSTTHLIGQKVPSLFENSGIFRRKITF